MVAKRSTDNQKDQIDRFKEAARALGCDEDEAAFDTALRQIASYKPKKEKSAAAPTPKRTNPKR